MELRLSDRLLKLKIRLALAIQKLNEHNQQSFAGYIYSNIAQLYHEIDELRGDVSVGETERRLQNIVKHLSEIENVLIACKMGIKLPLEDSTLESLKELKSEIKELIRRQQFSTKLAS